MSLESLVINRRPILNSGGETLFEVRGLTPFDIGILMQSYAVQMIAAYGRVREAVGPGAVSTDEVQSLLTELIQTTPDVICGFVALAADEPDQVEKVKFLPLPIMLDALISVYELTFTTEEELKKFAAVILNAIEVMTALIQKQTTTKKTSKTN